MGRGRTKRSPIKATDGVNELVSNLPVEVSGAREVSETVNWAIVPRTLNSASEGGRAVCVLSGGPVRSEVVSKEAGSIKDAIVEGPSKLAGAFTMVRIEAFISAHSAIVMPTLWTGAV